MSIQPLPGVASLYSSVQNVRHYLRHHLLNNVSLQRLLVIAGVLVASLVVPRIGQNKQLLVALIGPIVGVAILLLRQPSLGILGLIITIIIPINGTSGVNATMGMVGVLTMLWIVDMLIRERGIHLLPVQPFRPLFYLLGVSILAFLFGQLPWFRAGHPATMGAQAGGLAIVLLSGCAFLVLAHQLRSLHWLEALTWLYLIIFAVHIASWFITPLEKLVEVFYPIHTTGSLFWLWGVAFSFAMLFYHSHLHPLIRLALVGLLIATLYVILFPLRGWNSGWTPALVAIVAMFWVATPRLGALATILGFVAASSKFQKLVDLVMIGDNAYSLGTRLDAWLIVLKMVQVNPILGLGFANYNAYTPLFPIRGYAVKFNSHSQYIDLIAQTGVLGLSCFLWFFLSMSIFTWRLSRYAPAGYPRAYVYAVFGGIIGTLVSAALGDWVLPFFFNIGMYGFRESVLSWVFMGGVVALAQILNREATLSIVTSTNSKRIV